MGAKLLTDVENRRHLIVLQLVTRLDFARVHLRMRSAYCGRFGGSFELTSLRDRVCRMATAIRPRSFFGGGGQSGPRTSTPSSKPSITFEGGS